MSAFSYKNPTMVIGKLRSGKIIYGVVTSLPANVSKNTIRKAKQSIAQTIYEDCAKNDVVFSLK